MIFTVSLRPVIRNGEKSASDRVYLCPLEAYTVSEMLLGAEEQLRKIPEEERYNLFYTPFNPVTALSRTLTYQRELPIDIDDIDKSVDIEEYVNVVVTFLGIPRDKLGIVATGNGLQVLIGLDEGIEDDSYFDKNRGHYTAFCDNLQTELFNKGLLGVVDTSVFSKGRLLRLPGTRNVKDKGETASYLLNGYIKKTGFDLVKLSRVPEVSETDYMAVSLMTRFPDPKPEEIIEGCNFLEYCRDNANDVDEPQWYAMLSILGRFPEGRKWAHDFSSRYDGYRERSTDLKLKHALNSSGPRTCSNIESLWGGCFECPNYQKVTSPICISNKVAVKTEGSGYWLFDTKIDKTGNVISKRTSPDYMGLMEHFQRMHDFITIEQGSMTYAWQGTHWEYLPVTRMNYFIEQELDPKPLNKHCLEFVGKIQRNNVRDIHFFTPETTQGKMNFKNGVYCMLKDQLMSHDKNIGFRYVLPFDFDPEATCPRFLKFMEEITCGDIDVMKLLLEYLGYSLCGMDASIGQKALVLVGDGSNGKSVFLDVLKHLAGEGNFSALSMGNELSNLQHRHQLDGKLFNVSEETPTNAMIDNSIFKSMVTGGDIQARKLYCDAYTFKNNAKIVMACNELPSTTDLSNGMFRRLLIVPFSATFKEGGDNFDPMLREKLYSESAGIFNLIIASMQVFKERKVFIKADKVERALINYRESNDHVGTWWGENMRESEKKHNMLSLRDVYMDYKVDAEMDGEKIASFAIFCKKIRHIVSQGFRAKYNESRLRRVYEGRKQQVVYSYEKGEYEDDESADEFQTKALPPSTTCNKYGGQDEEFGLVLGNGSGQNGGSDQYTQKQLL